MSSHTPLEEAVSVLEEYQYPNSGIDSGNLFWAANELLECLGKEKAKSQKLLESLKKAQSLILFIDTEKQEWPIDATSKEYVMGYIKNAISEYEKVER